MRVAVHISPKQGVRNPEGETVLRALGELGFGEVQAVSCGKLLLLDIAAASKQEATRKVTAMCKALLVNETIEQFELSFDNK